MAPRRVLLLLLVAAAVACASSSSPAVVHAARDLPPHRADADVPAAETTTAFVQPPTVDADGVSLRGVLPHLIHPSVLTDDAAADPSIQRTVYDVTVVFRATARLGPPRLQYYVVPADASVPVSSAGAGDSTKARADPGVISFSMGLMLGATLVAVGVCILVYILGNDDDESSRDSATPKNPEVVLAQAAGAAKARRGY